jgi:c(7)-type cytochrome triheme protein
MRATGQPGAAARLIVAVLAWAVAAAGPGPSAQPAPHRKPSAGPATAAPPPSDHGRVLLQTFTPGTAMGPVQFDHWRHRARHTCRVCHVDVGFAMAAGETKVSASTNQGGFHCGACHDGKTPWQGAPVFAACTAEPARAADEARCRRCHDRGDAAQRRKDYEAFARDLPRRGAAGDVDWEEAEARGQVKPVDFLPGSSIQRPALKMEKDVAIQSKVTWISQVLFSHRKHAVWNGCEACHPEIFPSTRKGAVKYSMMQIGSGEYCGACHGPVAFGLADCERCHVRPVR